MTINQLERIRRLCLRFPEAWEKLSHGAPAFFSGKRLFATFIEKLISLIRST
mgnify:CR=1 FL=1